MTVRIAAAHVLASLTAGCIANCGVRFCRVGVCRSSWGCCRSWIVLERGKDSRAARSRSRRTNSRWLVRHCNFPLGTASTCRSAAELARLRASDTRGSRPARCLSAAVLGFVTDPASHWRGTDSRATRSRPVMRTHLLRCRGPRTDQRRKRGTGTLSLPLALRRRPRRRASQHTGQAQRAELLWRSARVVDREPELRPPSRARSLKIRPDLCCQTAC
jgi:hypothetical protein